jgi:hypothetical protein
MQRRRAVGLWLIDVCAARESRCDAGAVASLRCVCDDTCACCHDEYWQQTACEYSAEPMHPPPSNKDIVLARP